MGSEVDEPNKEPDTDQDESETAEWEEAKSLSEIIPSFIPSWVPSIGFPSFTKRDWILLLSGLVLGSCLINGVVIYHLIQRPPIDVHVQDQGRESINYSRLGNEISEEISIPDPEVDYGTIRDQIYVSPDYSGLNSEIDFPDYSCDGTFEEEPLDGYQIEMDCSPGHDLY